MYVKLFNRILDSSLADNRRLRHFFTDLLLCADADGNVIMTKKAIANRIRAGVEEVEWGLSELSKPDQNSLSLEHEGRRITPLEGHGYGWKIVNYESYRDLKTARELRERTAERVKKWREKRKGKGPGAMELLNEQEVNSGKKCLTCGEVLTNGACFTPGCKNKAL